MKYFINTILTIIAILLSSSFFLFVHNEVGFEFTVNCLFTWGYALFSYLVLFWIIYCLSDFLDFE